ncbi:MAG: tetratricopeptide repeat protein [Acidovorax sp.]|uniref:tetratricopeptide repeat protein n=1 Tax=Acidovorax sp. TaxID=1872122 RepID=UPI0039E3A3E6
MTTDSLGNPITLLHGAGSAAAVNDFVEGFIACEARAVNVLAVAQDTSPIVQACCAALHMFAESGDAPRNARPFITQAQATRATEREQRFVAAVAAWVDGDLPRAIALHEEQARLHPRDLASLKLGQYHLFNRGDSPGMLRLALHAQQAAADVPYLHGMLAFGYEQCHFLPQAEAAARHAITLRRKEPWAHHALAHVLLTQGRIAEGAVFMAGVSDTWTGLNSFMLTHNWWHQALFLLEQDRHAEVLRLYDSQVWGVVKEYTQDQIGAVSLLARLELAGVDVGNRWADVADHLALRLADHVLPFLDLQYLYGLARAGRADAAQTLLHNIEAHAATRTEAHERTVWRDVCVPAAHGLLAHAQGDWASAARHLGAALPRMVEIGGSHAQRDLFHQVWLDALQRNGQWAAAQNLLQPLANAQPESLRLARMAASANAALGLSARAQDALSSPWHSMATAGR